MCELVFSIQEFLQIVPGLVIFPLTFYLAWKKIGSNISCIIKWQSSRICADRISNVILSNHKDKPVTIFEIIAVYEKHISFSVEEFKKPIILKPLETLSIETSRYSSLNLPKGEWAVPIADLHKLEIFLITSGGEIKCNTKVQPGSYKDDFNKKYLFASKFFKTYNGISFNDEALYAVTHIHKDDEYISIVDYTGFIVDSGPLGCNMVPNEHLKSEASVLKYLKQSTGKTAIMVRNLKNI